MLSILIPVYNYNVYNLVKNIHHQINGIIDFEIICFDDGSKMEIIEENSKILEFNHTQYLKHEKNYGRNKARQFLCDKARYDWLLYLDADVLPKSESFISNYLDYINKNIDAVYGGFAYYKKTPKKALKLRWEYGRKREEVKARIRNLKPYKSIISANFLIKKHVFKTINKQIKGNLYGEDNHFGALLKSHEIKIKHIDNEVFHLGIEPSAKYLDKKEQAALTLLNIYNSDKNFIHDNDLLKLFEKSKRFKFNYVFAVLFKLLKVPLRLNLLSNYPSVNLLQLYRIGFMCHYDLKKK